MNNPIALSPMASFLAAGRLVAVARAIVGDARAEEVEQVLSAIPPTE